MSKLPLNTKDSVMYVEMFKEQQSDGTWDLKIHRSFWEQPSNEMLDVPVVMTIEKGLVNEPMLEGTDYT